MFVLRECRQIAAVALERSIGEVHSSTDLGDRYDGVRSRLIEVMVGVLAREQIIDGDGDVDGARPPSDIDAGRDVAAVSDEVTRAAVRLLVANRLDVAVSELSSTLNFALDLGADSLTRVDLVLLLEETLEVSVPDDSMFLVQTVGDAELFAVLFDRTREEVVLTLGEAARDLTFDTPLERFGASASEVALQAAGRAVGPRVALPACRCDTLKDAVRLAFLTAKLRRAFADAAGLRPAEITSETRPADVGLSEEATALVDELTVSMDLGSGAVAALAERTLAAIVGAIAELSGDEGVRR